MWKSTATVGVFLMNGLVWLMKKTYIEKIERSVPSTDAPQHITQYTQEMDDRDSQDCDTFMSQSSFEAALCASGSVTKAVEVIAAGTYRNAFCCVRPPGHHCGFKGHTTGATTQGYCIFNNIAIGAIYAHTKFNFNRIAVVDIDVHHGNGTEEILGGKEHYLFISLHVGSIYPHTGEDNRERSSNVLNISLEPRTSSMKYHEIFDSRVIPRLEQYNPDLLMISAGFDAHKEDPTERGMQLKSSDYFELTEKLKKIADKCCNGKLISVLEGGYDLPSLQDSVQEHILSLICK